MTLDSAKNEPFVDEQILRQPRWLITNSARIATLTLLEHDHLGVASILGATIASYDLSRRARCPGAAVSRVELYSGARQLAVLAGARHVGWGRRAIAAPAGEGPPEWFAVASVSSEIVALATWTLDGDVVVVGQHIVAPSWRGLGLGTRLLNFLEAARSGLEARRAVVLRIGIRSTPAWTREMLTPAVAIGVTWWSLE